ncbi:MAG: sigma-70 family RNA polymerase sigma factor, partial [Clostridia bacterium]|nr:sigma-70 family RNA polymerase sigma factor [Clostridia bacterium]
WMLRKESADLLYRALSALDSPAKEIVIMRYMEDIPGAVVADLLSMNESTVRTILHRSLKKLKKELEGYYNGKE